MPGVTHYHAQLGLRDKGCAIKGFVVYWANGRLWIHHNYKTWMMFLAVWRGLEPKAKPSPLEVIIIIFLIVTYAFYPFKIHIENVYLLF